MRNDYLKLKNEPQKVSLEELSFFIGELHNNPRLTEVICEFLRDNWLNYNPSKLNILILNKNYSNRLLVVVDQIMRLCKSDDETLTKFKKWASELTKNIKMPNQKEFFFSDKAFSDLSSEIIEFLKEDIKSNSTDSFLKFNFYGKDEFFNKSVYKDIKK